MASKKHKKNHKETHVNPVAAKAASILSSQKDVKPLPELIETISQTHFKRIFYGSLGFMLVFILITGFNVGYHCDEMDMNAYGKSNYNYYLTGGKDSTFYRTARDFTPDENDRETAIKLDTTLQYYGGAFEYLTVGLNKITGLIDSPQEYNSRHALNQIFAIIGILFAGLITFKIAGWRAAIFTEWLLFLTPVYYGNALFNSKDIPFSTGYIASMYFMMSFFEQLPKPTWKTVIMLMLSFAFATGIRIGGILLMFYFLLFLALYIIVKKELRSTIKTYFIQLGLKVFTVGVGGMVLVVLSWPFLLKNPVPHILATINLVKRFPQKVILTFEGQFTDSLHIPDYYLVKFMAITIPVFIIIAIVASIITIIYRRNITDFKKELLILFAGVYPIIFAYTSNVALYSAWRHFLFVYPCLVIIAGVGLGTLMKYLRKPALQIGLVVVSALAMLHPIIWSFKNHPYEYVYFNEAEGGFKSAYNDYEMDYWEISMKPAVDWLFAHEHLADKKDTTIITTNALNFTKYYIQQHYPKAKIKVTFHGFKKRSYGTWTYGIFNDLFIPPDIVERDFPPGGTIHTIDIDGKPVNAIMKDTSRFDMRAIVAGQEGQYKKADSLFTLYFNTVDSNNAALWGFMGFAKALNNDYNGAFYYGNKMIGYDTKDYMGYLAIAVAYLNKGDVKTGVSYLTAAYRLNPKDQYIQSLVTNLQAGGLIKVK